ncbi:MAG: hypothetical protein JXQ72_13680 [Anaerolineae bacterium]|nr:hypothetical protein [Anaerolineae bacterium]
MRHLECDPNVEVRGETLLALIENINAENIAPYLRKHKLTHIQAGGWFPMRNFHNLLNDLVTEGNWGGNFVAIGMAIAETAYMPPELGQPSFVDMIEHWDDHYQSNHRNGDIGYKTAQKLADRHYELTLHGGLYPDDFEYGVLYGFAKRFLPPGTDFTVWYAEDVQRLDQGGEKTVIRVRWEE